MKKKLSPEKIVNGMLKVASLPMVYVKISEALKNPNTSNKDFEIILSDDPAITARVLRLVNSAFYGFPSQIDTISKAITIMGQQQLHDIVFACSFVNAFKNLPQDVVNMESFWRHSIACGIAARILAVYRRETNVERYFIAGLIHDIGRLVIYTELEEMAREILLNAKESGQLLYKIEQEELGFNHATLGALLLKNWKLPDSLVEAVANHHKPMTARRYRNEVGIIHMADVICHAMQYGTSGDNFVPPLNKKIFDIIDIPAEALSPILDQLSIQNNEAVNFILGDAA